MGVPLSKYSGHKFTLHFHNLNKFQEAKSPKDDIKSLRKRSVINFKIDALAPRGYKIVAKWQHMENFVNTIEGKQKEFLGYKLDVQLSDGSISEGIMIGPLVGNPMENYVLQVTCQEHKIFDEQVDASLYFIGGFDIPQAVTKDVQRAGFLTLMYPVTNFKELIGKIGSIDLD